MAGDFNARTEQSSARTSAEHCGLEAAVDTAIERAAEIARRRLARLKRMVAAAVVLGIVASALQITFRFI